MFEMLNKLKERTKFHMPGHLGYSPFGPSNEFAFDTTELPITDNLYEPQEHIFLSEKAIAKASKSKGSIMLPGGATAGILAMILYSLKPGEKIILPRSSHKSITNGLILSGAEPIYVCPRFTEDNHVYYLEEDFLEKMCIHGDAKAILVTRPDYYGHLMKIDNIAKLAKKNGQLFLVDEAHGAHLNWFEDIKNSMELGANMAVQSAHKTLPVLTGGAWLHYGEDVNPYILRQSVQITQTSSPSFLILKSLDDGRVWMDTLGKKAIIELKNNIRELFYSLEKSSNYKSSYGLWRNEIEGEFDPLRIVIEAPEGGFVLAENLSKIEIDIEMADFNRIVCIPSLMPKKESFSKLLDALKNMNVKAKKDESYSLKHFFENKSFNQRALSLRETFFRDKKWMPLSKAKGLISAVAIGLYPPGIPLIVPGEIITEEAITFLNNINKRYVFGLLESGVYCIK